MKKLLLFDVDGTISESGQMICPYIGDQLNLLKQGGYEIGIVGGGKFEKIVEQMGNITFHHYFSECGSVYHDGSKREIYRKNIRQHPTYSKINVLLKTTLKFLSEVDYTITGQFIDLRSGLIYISLIGLVANNDERKYFLDLDVKNKYREKLLYILKEKAEELGISEKVDTVYGGSVGIAIYPKEYDKVQVLETITKTDYDEIHYFGDKYLENGNDYQLLNHSDTIGYRVDSPNETLDTLISLVNHDNHLQG
jgi:phosphomannomutase